MTATVKPPSLRVLIVGHLFIVKHLLVVKHLSLVRHLCKTKHTKPIESKSSTHYTCSVFSSDERRIQTIWQRFGSRRIVSYLKLHHSMKSCLGKTGWICCKRPLTPCKIPLAMLIADCLSTFSHFFCGQSKSGERNLFLRRGLRPGAWKCISHINPWHAQPFSEPGKMCIFGGKNVWLEGKNMYFLKKNMYPGWKKYVILEEKICIL